MSSHFVRLLFPCLFVLAIATAGTTQDSQTRRESNPARLRSWLENMVWHHRYTIDEVAQVTGLPESRVNDLLTQWGISEHTRPHRPTGKLFTLPYPGGRHPRTGFLDGAIDPQRETKLSAFCPWDDTSYVVLDVPEAIWSDLGLTYLAHTHVDTIWTKQSITLEQTEWKVLPDGNFQLDRKLPNGIEFGVKVIPKEDHLRMKMWLTNGTEDTLTDLRVQQCCMLKGAAGFRHQHNDDKRFVNGYSVAKANEADRWIITAWDPLHRGWANAKCPCLHSDPKFPDCPPGQTTWLRGWFSFYEGDKIDEELQRIEATNWRTHQLHHVTGNLVGKVVDATSGKMLPCRLSVKNLDDQSWHFARSTAVAGSAVMYDKQFGKTASIEKHTTLSADGFQLDVPPGKYLVRAEHGKEFIPIDKEITVGDGRVSIKLPLRRMTDMAQRGWYSGDTHVHRSMEDLPNVMHAEDLNVALPLNYWVRNNTEVPANSGPKFAPRVQNIDASHLIYPINTEYEIFSINGKRHTQGAVFVLNHKQPLEIPAPPTRKIAAAARQQGALLDLDKHSWNWSAMVVPVMNVDLFELSNNHHWRTEFGFTRWTLESAPHWPQIERNESGFTERGWTEFGFQTYYAFLNCGFRMRVSAGTASGVHPVPLGHGRVYVHTGSDFSFDNWMKHLDAGHSFVTQGPLLDVTFNDALPGTTWNVSEDTNAVAIEGDVISVNPLATIEIIRNGIVIESIDPRSNRTDSGACQTRFKHTTMVRGSGWLAVRCFEQLADDRVCFAHTNPVFVDVEGQPLKPLERDLDYFIQRMDSEITRNKGVLTDDALSEFREAKSIYESLRE